MPRLFGTDGIRGQFGTYPIVVEFCEALATAVANRVDRGTSIVLGRDTRASGQVLAEAIAARFAACGLDVVDLGVVPSPFVAYSAKRMSELGHSSIGLVITASHNPASDNGFKFFNQAGRKFSESWETDIERRIEDVDDSARSGSVQTQSTVSRDGLYDDYQSLCEKILSEQSVTHLSIGLDCASGAWHAMANEVLAPFVKACIQIDPTPDGRNINHDYGSNHPTHLAEAVRAQRLDVGFAFDGDGDRIAVIDEQGNVCDGDQVIYTLVHEEFERNGSFDGGVVGTIMTNGGLAHAVEEVGIPFHRTPVGDRFISEALHERRWTLGGEPSGHIINTHYSPTGDGLLVACQLLRAMARNPNNLSQLTSKVALFNQEHRKEVVNSKEQTMQSPVLAAAIRRVADEQPGMRVIVRPSGTEPVIRVMVEGEDLNDVRNCADYLASQLRESA